MTIAGNFVNPEELFHIPHMDLIFRTIESITKVWLYNNNGFPNFYIKGLCEYNCPSELLTEVEVVITTTR